MMMMVMMLLKERSKPSNLAGLGWTACDSSLRPLTEDVQSVRQLAIYTSCCKLQPLARRRLIARGRASLRYNVL
jgi:hypothetical protein